MEVIGWESIVMEPDVGVSSFRNVSRREDFPLENNDISKYLLSCKGFYRDRTYLPVLPQIATFSPA